MSVTPPVERTPATPSAPRPPNPRAKRRRLLYVIGLVPLLLALVFAWKIFSMRSNDGDGLRAFEDSDGEAALEAFNANLSQNWFEPWVAHFDTGNAAFILTDYERAVGHYHDAIDVVPHEHVCDVRINLALTQERLGDVAVEDGDAEGARTFWEDGIIVLDDGKCPVDAPGGKEQTADGAAIKKRLEEKLKPPEQQKKNDQQDPKKDPKGGQGEKKQPQTPEERERQRKRDQLEKRNREGEQDRREYKDYDDYDDYGYDYQW